VPADNFETIVRACIIDFKWRVRDAQWRRRRRQYLIDHDYDAAVPRRKHGMQRFDTLHKLIQ